MLDKTIKKLHRNGFRLLLCEDSRCWSATALGANPERTESGAMYTRAIGFGKTPDAAMKELLEKLTVRSVEDDALDRAMSLFG
jgi:hypothetical protein